ncbi:MAG: filamentous hemagglutinin N-terminal domain-containing protein [Agarilytica sp.]
MMQIEYCTRLQKQIQKRSNHNLKHTLKAIFVGLFAFLSQSVFAGPEGGEVVGGAGNISRDGTTTTINQATDRMAIDWQSYNVNANERVHYIQPDSSSISLNRILGNSASHIHGRIDANGQVFLVNPNGVFFGKDSVINAGGILASGLSIDPGDFMNGDLVFSALEGTDGLVINGGLLNAATGGYVNLLGQQIQNDGVISAQLGSVNLAAGREAILTFDDGGLLGVQITESILQDDIGVDAAILNNGEITAEDGQVLISAAASQDVFTQAVNSGELKQARSVVVDEDGSFTLSAGANVVNTGTISASGESGGDVIVLGENITSSGHIFADAGVVESSDGNVNQQAGNIEIHSVDTTLITEQGSVSATASAGSGGDIKLFGNKVGLSESATINASGESGGGQVLFGGDETGSNNLVRNAQFIFLGEHTSIYADALGNGNGGRLITFAENTARVYGGLSAQGGQYGGDGGFIETSGLISFEILTTPNVNATEGQGGHWLIDPYDITIDSFDGFMDDQDGGSLDGPDFHPTGAGAQIAVGTITDALDGGNTVTIATSGGGGTDDDGDITFNNELADSGSGASTLILNADGDINTNGQDITGTGSGLSLEFNAGGDVLLGTSAIDTNGGSFTATGVDFTADDTSSITTGGGNVNIYVTGAVSLGADVTTDGGNFTVGGNSNATRPTSFNNYLAGAGGTITTSTASGAGDISITTVLDATTNGDVTLGAFSVSDGDSFNDLGGEVTVISGNDITLSSAWDYHATGDNTLDMLFSLTAHDDIFINAQLSDERGGGVDTLNMVFTANDNTGGFASGAGSVHLNANVFTAGGNFTASGVDFDNAGFLLDTDNATNTNPLPGEDISSTTNGGDITITSTGAVTLGQLITDTEGGATGNVDISGSSISDSGTSTITVQGTNTFTASSGALAIVLDNSGHTFADPISIASDVNDLALGNISIATNGEAVNITAVGDITQPTGTDAVTLNSSNLTVNAASVQVNDITTMGLDDTDAGDVTLTATTGALTAGNINAVGGNAVTAVGGGADNGRVGLNGGNVLLSGNGLVTVSSIASSGSDGFDNSGNGTNEFDGGNAGSISVTSVANNIVTGALTADGGNGDAQDNDNDDDANGGNANTIQLVANVGTGSITLSDNVFARGGHLFEVNNVSPSVANGAGGSITIDGNIVLTAPVLIDSDLADSPAGNNATGTSTPADITITGTIDGTTALTETLTINGANFDFDGNIGAATSLGAIVIDATAGINADNENLTIRAASFAVNSGTSFYASDINTTGAADAAGGNITINVGSGTLTTGNLIATGGAAVTSGEAGGAIDLDAGTITAGDISTNGTEAVTGLGGAGNTITIDAERVTVGAINASGGDSAAGVGAAGGAVTLTADDDTTDGTPDIAISGDINSLAGLDDDDLTRTNGQGAVNLVLTGDDVLTGSITLPSLADFITSDISITGSSGTDTLNGPSITNTASLWTVTGANAGTISDAGATSTVTFTAIETLQGGSEADQFALSTTEFDGSILGGAGTDTVIGAAQDTEWNITGANTFTITGVSDTTFGEMENLEGNAGDHADTFNLLAGTVWAGGVNGGGGTSDVVVAGNESADWSVTAANNTGTVTGIATTFSFVEILRGDDDAATVDTFDVNSGESFTGSIEGRDGDDIFNLDEDVTVAISGGDGDDDFNLTADSITARVEGDDGADDFVIGDAVVVAIVDGFNNGGGDDSDTDTLTAFDSGSDTTWTIDGTTDDVVVGSTDVDFVRIDTLQGGTGVDNFNVTSVFTGTLSGGAGIDTFDIDAAITGSLNGEAGDDIFHLDADVTVAVNAGDDDDTININTSITATSDVNGDGGDDTFNVDDTADISVTIVGGELTEDGAGDTLALVDATGNHTWVLDSENSGTLNDDIDFSEIENLDGSNGGNDTFDFNFYDGGGVDIGQFEGTVDARNGDDIVDLVFAGGNVDIVLGSEINQVQNAAIVQGAGAASTFTVVGGTGAGTTTWAISDFDGGGVADGVNDGVVTNGVNSTSFIDFGNLVGDSEDDQFTVANTASIVSVDGATGTANTLSYWATANADADWAITGANDGTINTTTLVFTDIQTVTGSGNDNLTARNSQTNVWELDSADGGTVEDTGATDTLAFSGFDALTGGDEIDTFNVDNGVDFTGAISGSSGNDVFNLVDDVTGGINGNGGDDDFNITNTALSSTVRGNGGNDELYVLGNNIDVTFNGGDDTDIVIGFDDAVNDNNWDVNNNQLTNDANPGSIIDFSNVEALTGGTGVDIFTITANVTRTLNGSAGSDEIIAPNLTNAWVLASDNAGTLNGVSEFTFTGIEIFTGGTGDDTLTGIAQDNNWQITGTNSGTLEESGTGDGTVTFTAIENLVGNSGDDDFTLGASGVISSIDGAESTDDDDTLIARDVANTWNLTNSNLGNLQTTAGPTTYVSSFTNIETLDGSDSAADTFNFSVFANYNILAGASIGDTANYSAVTADVAITVGAGVVAGLDDIEEVVGNNDGLTNTTYSSELTLDTSNSATWTISDADGGDGINDGSISFGSNTIVFTNFSDLVGGTGNDTFDLDPASGSSGISGSIDGGTGTLDSIVARDVATDWNIFEDNSGGAGNEFAYGNFTYENGEDDGGVPATAYESTSDFTGIEEITGSDQGDTYTVDNFTVGGAFAITLNGGTGVDTITLPNQDLDITLGQAIGGIGLNGFDVITANAARANILRSTTASGTVAWAIDGDNSGSVDGVAFNNFQSLYGGDANDTFAFDPAGVIDTLIDGGNGANVISARSMAARWNISGPNTGSVDDITGAADTYVGSFQNIQTLTGSSVSNEFIFGASGYFGGTITGGAGTDEISVAEMAGEDTLWLVDNASVESGTVRRADSADNSSITSSATFTEIESLVGGDGTDKFIFGSAAAFTGSADAGGGANDVVDLSGIAGAISVAASATNIHGIDNAELLIGNDSDTSLTGLDTSTNTWTIDGANEGQLGNGGTIAEFSGVTTLIGSDLVADQFDFEVGGSISGQVEGGAGAFTDVVTGHDDTNTWTLSTALAGDLDGSNFIEVEEIVGGSGTDTLLGRAQENNWLINASDAGYVEGADSSDRMTFSELENLSGNSSDDHFVFDSTGSLSGVIDADSGASSAGDSVTVSSTSGQSITWTLNGTSSGTIATFLANGFSDVDVVIGGDGQDAVNVTSAFSGTIQTLANVDTITLGASVTGNIETGAGNDQINISDSSATAMLIDGGTESDTVTLTHTDASDWTLNSIDGGSVTSSATVNFDGIEVVEGNSAIDTLTVDSDFSGDVYLFAGNDDVTLNANITGTFNTGDNDDLVRIAATGLTTTVNTGNNSDTLRITHTSDSTWVIDGTNTVDGVSFSNVETLEGNDAVDTITLTDAINRIDTFGGEDTLNIGDDVTTLNTGDDNDTINIDVDGITVVLDAGNGATDQLNITHANTSTWTFDTADTVDNVTFSAVENLQGNGAVDTVVVNTAFTGSLDTLAANDQVTLNADFADLDLGAGNDDVDITIDNLTATIVGGDDSDTLTITHASTSDWDIDTSSTVDSISFTEFENLVGNNQVDTVVVNSAISSIDTSGGNDVIGLNADVATLLAGGGDDTIFVNISTFAGNINAGNNSDELIGPARAAGQQNDWNITSDNSGTLNTTAVFSNVETVSGNDGDDVFVIDDGATIENVRGIALALGVDTGTDTLNINDVGTTNWTVSGDGEGAVNAGASNFYSIENLTGGADVDQFVFNNINALISGLIDGGEDQVAPNIDSVTDSLDLTVFTTGVVVELGDTVTPSNPEPTITTNLHVDNIEQITAAPGISDAGEDDNWVAVNYTEDVRWRLTPFNDGYFELLVSVADGTAIENTRIDFLNFGSIRGGDGNEDSDINPGTNITGQYIAGDGLRTLNYGAIDPSELILVDVDDRILSVTGNGNTIIRSIASTNDDWVINAPNTGQYTNNIDITFDFTQVNQLIGGSGNDSFTFTATGDLIDGSINGGTGVNTIDSAAALSDLLFGLNELASNVTVSVSYIGGVTSSVDFTETLLSSRTGIVDLLNISDLDANAATNNTLYSGVTPDYIWSIGQSGSDNSVSGNAQTLTFTNVGNVVGGDADDTFNVFSLGSITDSYDGGLGDDTVDFTALTGAINLSLDSEVTTNIDVQVQGIETLELSGSENRMVGGDAGSTWTIDQINAGSVVYGDDAFIGTQSLTMTGNVSHIVAGGGNDDFIFDGAGIINGTIDGGAGIDTLNASTSSQGLVVQISGVNDDVTDTGASTVDLFAFEDVSVNSAQNNELRANAVAANTWTINGSDAGALNGMTFSGFANLTGSTSVDTFTLDGSDVITGVIDGGLGVGDQVNVTGVIRDVVVAVSDTATSDISIVNIEQVDALGLNNRIVADDEVNSWVINDFDDGQLSGASFENALAFTGFANLQGGSDRDNFVFDVNGQVSGQIDGTDPAIGTALQIDTVDLSALNSAVTISLNSAVDGDVDLLNIEEIIANATLSNSLYADDIDNNWLIDEENTGDLLNSNISFAGFANIFGGSGNDIFTFEALGNITGVVDGGSQPVNGADQVDMSQLDVVRVVVGDTTSGFVDIESYRGNNTDSIITAANLTNTWTLDGAENSGRIVDQLSNTILFEDFNELEGGTQNDDFILSGGSVSGEIRGGLGNDDLIVTVVDGVNGQVSFDGGDGTDTVSTSGGNIEYTASYTADLTGAASLEYNFQDTNALVTYSVDYVDVESVTDNVLASVLTVNDLAANADTIVLDTAQFTLNALEQVTYDNKNSLSVLAENGDSVFIEGPVVLASTVEISSGSVVANDTDAEIQALQVNFVGNQTIGTADTPIELNVDGVAIESAQGNVYLSEANTINITSMSNNSGDINLVAGSDIADGSALSGSSVLDFTSLNGSILLNENNSFTNTINLVAANDIELTNTSTSLLGDITAQNLTVIAGGNVTDQGTINISANASFTMNSNNLLLNSPANDFSNVSVTGANNVDLVDVDDVSVQGSALGDFTVVAENQISAIVGVTGEDIFLQSNTGAVSINGNVTADNSVTLIGEGVDVFAEVRVSDTSLGNAVEINAGAGTLVLAGGIDTSNSNAVAGDVVLTGSSIDQQQSANIVGGDIALTSATSITQSSDILAEGNVTTLANGGNIDMEPGSLTQGQTVELSSTADITLETIIADTLIINGVNIYQLGNLIVDAEVTVQAGDVLQSAQDTSLTSTTGNIVLDATTIDLDGNVAALNGSITGTTSGDILSSASLSANTIVLDSGGAIAMTSASTIIAETGISLTAENDLALSSLQVNPNIESTITLVSDSGGLQDNNGDTLNFIANVLDINTETNIGSSSDAIDTQVAVLNALNNGVGAPGFVNIANDGALSVTALRSNTDISIANQGTLTMVNSSDPDYAYDRTDTDARTAGGTINANYNSGTVNIIVDGGDLLAANPPSLNRNRPEIVGEFVNVSVDGNFGGTNGRPIVVYAQEQMSISRASGGIFPIWGFNTPPNQPLITDADLVDSSAIGNVSELLVDVESADEIDPAIFTEVRNYSYDNISIRMPRDQLYEEEEEEEGDEFAL